MSLTWSELYWNVKLSSKIKREKKVREQNMLLLSETSDQVYCLCCWFAKVPLILSFITWWIETEKQNISVLTWIFPLAINTFFSLPCKSCMNVHIGSANKKSRTRLLFKIWLFILYWQPKDHVCNCWWEPVVREPGEVLRFLCSIEASK